MRIPEAVSGVLNMLGTWGRGIGSGEHPTTRLCLRWILEQDWAGRTLLDYGTGSGILAIAALVRGARFAAGTDVDAQVPLPC